MSRLPRDRVSPPHRRAPPGRGWAAEQCDSGAVGPFLAEQKKQVEGRDPPAQLADEGKRRTLARSERTGSEAESEAGFGKVAGDKHALVPRTRSSHDFTAGTVANFGFKSGTRIIMLLVSFRFRSSLRGRRECLRTSESGH